MSARSTFRPFLLALLASIAVLAVPQAAHAAVLCVNMGAACPAGGTTSATYEAAIATANGNGSSPVDEIYLGAGTYLPGATTRQMTTPTKLVGSGRGVTTIVSSDATANGNLGVWGGPNDNGSASDLTVELRSNAGAPVGVLAGSSIAGGFTLSRVDVVAAAGATIGGQPHGISVTFGSLAADHVSAVLPCVVGAVALQVNSSGATRVSDARLDGCNGVNAIDAADLRIDRATITGSAYPVDAYNNGTVGTLSTIITNSVIRDTGSSLAAISSRTFGSVTGANQGVALYDDTVVNVGGGNGVGALYVEATPDAGKTTTSSITADGVAFVGFTSAYTVQQVGGSAGNLGHTSVSIAYSAIDPTKFQADPGSYGDTHHPGYGSVIAPTGFAFADAATGDYRPTAGSSLIDVSDSFYVSGTDGTIDLAGNPRLVAGKATTSAAQLDIGAYEYQHVAPTVTAAGPDIGVIGTPVAFSAVGADADPGETATLTYAWTLPDGASAAGPTVSWTPTAGANAAASVTVTDVSGRTGSATTPVVHVPAPPVPVTPVPVTPVVKDVSPPVVGLVVAALKRAALVQKAGPKLSTTVTAGEAGTVTTTFTLVAAHRKARTRRLVLASSVVTAKAAGKLVVKASTTAKVRRKISPFLAARTGDTYTLLVHVEDRDAAGNVGRRDASVRVR